MPISQSRMTGLLAAAQDYQGALRRALKTLEVEGQKVALGQADGASTVYNLQLMLQEQSLLDNPIASAAAIAAETAHWTPALRRRNEREAAKAAQRRQSKEQING